VVVFTCSRRRVGRVGQADHDLALVGGGRAGGGHSPSLELLERGVSVLDSRTSSRQAADRLLVLII
jgi:hypothetical protein